MIRIAMLSILWVLTGCAAAAPPSPPASTEPAGNSAESMTGLKAHRGIALHCEQDSDCPTDWSCGAGSGSGGGSDQQRIAGSWKFAFTVP